MPDAGLATILQNEPPGLSIGKVLLKDGSKPQTVGIIHCVGSRDKNTHEYCSRVCCMYSLKLAHLVHERSGAKVYNFYIDMRSAGKGYEEFSTTCSRRGASSSADAWPRSPTGP